MSIRHFIAVAWVSAVMLLGGCAALGGGANSSDPAVREQALRERVQARWNAFFANDYRKVYTFATPAYRQQYDYTHFANQYASQIQRDRIEIYKVEYDPELPDSAKVVVLLHYTAEGGAPGTTFQSYSRIVETWVRQDGQWWYVEPR